MATEGLLSINNADSSRELSGGLLLNEDTQPERRERTSSTGSVKAGALAAIRERLSLNAFTQKKHTMLAEFNQDDVWLAYKIDENIDNSALLNDVELQYMFPVLYQRLHKFGISTSRSFDQVEPQQEHIEK